MFFLDNNAFKLAVTGDENMLHHIAQNTNAIYVSSVTAEELVVIYLSAINRARSSQTSLSLP